MSWEGCVDKAKRELKIYGWVDSEEWKDMIELAKEFFRDEKSEEANIVYNNHIHSDVWKALRKQILDRDNYMCVDCGDRATSVHHCSYSNIGTVLEKNDCISLCKKCHDERENEKDDDKNKRYMGIDIIEEERDLARTVLTDNTPEEEIEKHLKEEGF